MGQRCLQAGRLAPFDQGRRLSGQNDVVEEPYSITDTRNEHRGLDAVAIEAPMECYTYCSVYGNEPTPFFFNWNTATNQCFCCGAQCTLILDPDFNAYKVVEAASGPFAVSFGSTEGGIFGAVGRGIAVDASGNSYTP